MQEIVLRLEAHHGFRPVMWIGDEIHNSFVEQSFPDCDLLDWPGLLGGKEPDTMSSAEFEVLSQYWLSKEFEAVREGLLEEFNRYMSPKHFRSIDREVFLRQIHLDVMAGIVKNKPQFFLASETPHNPVFLATYYLVRWLNMPTLFFQPTPTISPTLLPKSGLDNVFSAVSVSDLPERSVSRHLIADAVTTSINELASGNSTLAQRDERRRLEAGRANAPSLIRRAIRWLRRTLEASLTWWKGRSDGYIAAEAGLADALDYHRARLHDAHDGLPLAPAAKAFALFAMHYQPEKTSVPEGGIRSFQFENFVRARKFLPDEISLVVKEHESQISGINPGHYGRPSGLYDLLVSLPKTEVLSAYADTKSLLKSSKLVFTLTGSIAIEAALQGIPVVYFGNPWWAGTPGTYSYWGLNPSEPLDSLAPAPQGKVQKHLRSVIENQTVIGLGTPSSEEFWSRHYALGADFMQDAIDQFVRTTVRFVMEKLEADAEPGNGFKH